MCRFPLLLSSIRFHPSVSLRLVSVSALSAVRSHDYMSAISALFHRLCVLLVSAEAFWQICLVFADADSASAFWSGQFEPARINFVRCSVPASASAAHAHSGRLAVGQTNLIITQFAGRPHPDCRTAAAAIDLELAVLLRECIDSGEFLAASCPSGGERTMSNSVAYEEIRRTGNAFALADCFPIGAAAIHPTDGRNRSRGGDQRLHSPIPSDTGRKIVQTLSQFCTK